MKKLSATGHPSPARRNDSSSSIRRASLVLLALPLLAACPGQLDELAWLGSDGGRVTVLPPLTVPDASAPPVPEPAPALIVDAAPPPPVAVDAPPPRPKTPDAAVSDARASDAAKGGSDGATGGATPPLYDTSICAQPEAISAMILQPKCGNAGCHAKNQAAAGLDLVSPGAKMRLLNIRAKTLVAACANQPLVVDSPSVSGVFFQKLTGTTCGIQMPVGTTPLTANELACLQDWIKPGSSAPAPSAPAAGGGGGAGGSASDPACLTDDGATAMVLKPYCTMCHSKAMPSQQLDLESPGAKKRILGVTSKAGTCGGKVLANPDGTGLFFDKLTGTMPAGCGQQMPFGAVLNAGQIQCLRDWVKAP
jgi:hypothetical protein